MKSAVILLPLTLLATPALAASPVETPQAAAPATAAARFTLDTPIEALVADPQAKAVLDQTVPGLTAHPQYEMFKALGLTTLATFAPDKLTPDVLSKVKAGLAQIK